MSENLIQQIHSIENEADAAIQAAHQEAAALDRDADARTKKLADELDGKYQDEVKRISATVDAERHAQQDKLNKTFHASIEAVRGIRMEQAGTLVDKIVERISGS